MRLVGHTSVAWLTLAVFVVQGGCATTQRQPLLPLPPEIRAQLGRIGVVAGRFVPAADVKPPTSGKGSGAAKGAAVGAGVILGPASLGSVCQGSNCGPFAVAILALALGVATVAAATGALIGAVSAEPAATVQDAESALRHALGELKIQDTLRDRLVSIARDEAGIDLVPVGDIGPIAADVDADYGPLAAQGIDTLFEVSVTHLGLVGEWGVNPPLVLSMTTRIRLILTEDGAELYHEELTHRSGPRRFVEWAANDARAFREAMDATYARASWEIVRLTAPQAPAPRPTAPQPPPELSLRAVPINEWRAAPIGEKGAMVRYRSVEKGSSLDTCTSPLVPVRIYEGGVQCVPAELVK